MKRRAFIKFLSTFIVIILLFSNLNCNSTYKSSVNNKKPLIENLWLWGHTAGSHHNPVNTYNLPGKNLMGPKEASDYLGIKNCCRVAYGEYGPFPPLDNEAQELINLKEVVWSAIGDGSSKQHNKDQSDLDEILRIAEKYDNITGAILDDFFITPTADGQVARHSIESIRDMRNKLHNFNKRPLDLWLVWYTHQLDYELTSYIELFDVITFWEWKGSNLINFKNNIQEFISKTPRKRRLIGCYLWNFGEKKPMTIAQLEHQLQICYDFIKEGKIEGIVFCANTVVDIDLESVDFIRDWISNYGLIEI